MKTGKGGQFQGGSGQREKLGEEAEKQNMKTGKGGQFMGGRDKGKNWEEAEKISKQERVDSSWGVGTKGKAGRGQETKYEDSSRGVGTKKEAGRGGRENRKEWTVWGGEGNKKLTPPPP